MTQLWQSQVAARDATIFIGRIIHSMSLKALEILPRGAIGVRPDGIIAFVERVIVNETALKTKYSLQGFQEASIVRLQPLQFLFPGLVDTHLHAPQYPNLAIGMEGDLREWVTKYTDPIEASYKDNNKAKKVYGQLVQDTLAHGSTTVAYNSTIHAEATNILADICFDHGQRANIGKMACLINSTHKNFETSSAQSLLDTEICIRHIQQIDPNGHLLIPCVQPRGGPFCPPDLMSGLGQLSHKYKPSPSSPSLAVQAHMCEAPSDISLALQTHPGFTSYSDLYNHYGLLHSRSILAHCIHLTSHDIDLLVASGAGVAHNPNSNTCLRDGECRVRELLDRGVKVGLGTDCSAGYSISILDAMRQASNVSRHLAIRNDDDRWMLGFEEICYLATMGGARVLGLDHLVGDFRVGKSFDALVVDVSKGMVNHEGWEGDDVVLLKKWVFMGDDRNIRQVFVNGRLVSDKDIHE